MSRQLYNISNQPVTPHVPPFFHPRHTLIHTLSHSPACHRQPVPTHHFSHLPHALSHASCMLSHPPHAISSASCHENGCACPPTTDHQSHRGDCSRYQGSWCVSKFSE